MFTVLCHNFENKDAYSAVCDSEISFNILLCCQRSKMFPNMKIFILVVLIEISLSFEDEPLRIPTRVLDLDDNSKHTSPPNPTTPQTPPQNTGNVLILLISLC